MYHIARALDEMENCILFFVKKEIFFVAGGEHYCVMIL